MSLSNNKKNQIIVWLIIISIISINIISVSSSNENRFLKNKKIFIGKNKLDGIYESEKYDESIELLLIEESNKEKEEVKDDIKNKINFYEVDNEGNEYKYEIDDNELDDIIKKGKELLKKGSNNDNNNKNNNNNNNKEEIGATTEEDEGEDKETSEGKRRLAILYPDTRIEITSSTNSPYKQIGLLTFNDGNWCTATLIGPKTLLTAGHCLHAGNGGNWYNNFRFYPGRTRYTTSITGLSYTWSRAFTFSGWIQNGDWNYDIGLIELTVSPNIGYLSFGWDTNINSAYRLNLAGYPSDKLYGTMWYTNDYVYRTYTDQLLTDESDTFSGHSGSACYFYPSYLTYLRIFAAHSGSVTSSGITYNRHTRITNSKFTAFCTWINNPALC